MMAELPPNIREQSVHDCLAQMEQGKLSPSDLVNSYLERIESRDKEILAWSYVDAEAAREQAAQADKVYAEGVEKLPLLGIPIGIKDIIDTRAMPTAYGSPIFKTMSLTEMLQLLKF